MKKRIGTYKGANIYETERVENGGEELLSDKVWATGRHPSPSNLKVDFIPEGLNRYQNFSKLIEKIDIYLQEHNLDHFQEEE